MTLAGYNLQDNVYIYSNNKCMCVFLISPVPIAEPLTSELIDTPVFYNLAPRPIKYRVSVPIPTDVLIWLVIWVFLVRSILIYSLNEGGTVEQESGLFRSIFSPSTLINKRESEHTVIWSSEFLGLWPPQHFAAQTQTPNLCYRQKSRSEAKRMHYFFFQTEIEKTANTIRITAQTRK